jgi:hypothetical protein
VFGKRELAQDSVDALVFVVSLDHVQELLGGGVRWEFGLQGLDTDVLASLLLVVHVDLGRGILAHQDNRQAWFQSLCLQAYYFLPSFRL